MDNVAKAMIESILQDVEPIKQYIASIDPEKVDPNSSKFEAGYSQHYEYGLKIMYSNVIEEMFDVTRCANGFGDE